MKKFAVVSSILAIFGGVVYFLVMSIGDVFKDVGDPFDTDEFEDEF